MAASQPVGLSQEAAFERYLAAASRQAFTGWDFSYLSDRMVEDRPSWDYAERVRKRIPGAAAMLDMGTGGGEALAGMAPVPSRTMATEGYPPNVEVARRRLAPLGVEVTAVEGAPDSLEIAPSAGLGSLPFPDSSFPLVINRHESYYPAEVYRILAPGGVFITQQVGGIHHQALNRLLGASEKTGMAWSLAFAVAQLADVGFRVIDQREEFPETVFRDIGALMYYLKAIPWQVPDFTVAHYRDRLSALHERIEREGGLRIPGHLFYVEAVKPGD